jgi:hypothetical protein
VEAIWKMCKQSETESAAGLSHRCETADEGLALLKSGKNKLLGKSKNNVRARFFQEI